LLLLTGQGNAAPDAAWCRDHQNAAFVPSFAIPSGNVYRWRCAAGAPEIIDQIDEIDPCGFVARYWKRLN
jgi:hypothetical protein